MKPETAPSVFKRGSNNRSRRNNEQLAERSRMRNMKPAITDIKDLFKAEMVRDLQGRSVEINKKKVVVSPITIDQDIYKDNLRPFLMCK